MKDVNKIILIGRLGKDPVQRETRNGTAVVNFPVATSRRVQDSAVESGESKKEQTQWHHIVAWGKIGENCVQYLKKGERVYIMGSVRSRMYDGKDGCSRMSFEVHAEDVTFLGNKIRKESEAEAIAQ